MDLDPRPKLRGRFGQFYRYFEEVSSTQDALKEWALCGAPEGAVVLAENQTAGRGRRGRVWQSSPGSGIYASLLLRPKLPTDQFPLLSLMAGVALREATGLGGLKWPNDLMAPDGRKLGGILVEASIGSEPLVLLGFGLNYQPTNPEFAAVTEFREVKRLDLLVEILGSLEVWYQRLQETPSEIIEAWRQYSYMLGIQVAVGGVEGLALDITVDGELVLQLADGQTQLIRAGDVEIVRPIEI